MPTCLNLITLCLMLLIYRVAGAESVVPLSELRDACDLYVTVFGEKEVKDKAFATITEKLKSRMEDLQRSDRPGSNQSVLNDLAIAWFTDHRDALGKREPTCVILACCYFLYYIENGYELPSQIRQRVTKEDANKLVSWLKGQVSNKEKVGKEPAGELVEEQKSGEEKVITDQKK